MLRKLPIQIILTSLLLIFVFNNFGYWFCFKMEQADIKQEMFERSKRSIPNSQLTAITIDASTTNDLAWSEENEFSFKGELYDVVRSEKIAGGKIVYYCLNDAKEEALLANLSSHLNDNLLGGKTNGKHSNDLSKLFSQTYFNNVQEFYFFNDNNLSVRPASSINFTSINLDILCPPPDRIS